MSTRQTPSRPQVPVAPAWIAWWHIGVSAALLFGAAAVLGADVWRHFHPGARLPYAVSILVAVAVSSILLYAAALVLEILIAIMNPAGRKMAVIMAALIMLWITALGLHFRR